VRTGCVGGGLHQLVGTVRAMPGTILALWFCFITLISQWIVSKPLHRLLSTQGVLVLELTDLDFSCLTLLATIPRLSVGTKPNHRPINVPNLDADSTPGINPRTNRAFMNGVLGAYKEALPLGKTGSWYNL
jgi:hypothetical protein